MRIYVKIAGAIFTTRDEFCIVATVLSNTGLPIKYKYIESTRTNNIEDIIKEFIVYNREKGGNECK
jgi:hypothetical protein